MAVDKGARWNFDFSVNWTLDGFQIPTESRTGSSDGGESENIAMCYRPWVLPRALFIFQDG